MKWPWSKPVKSSDSYKAAFHQKSIEAGVMTVDEQVKAEVAKEVRKIEWQQLSKQRTEEFKHQKANYKPIGPRYKIAESPEGGYIIQERRIDFSDVSYFRGVFDGFSRQPVSLEYLKTTEIPEPKEVYYPLCEGNPMNPERRARRFNTFDEAEYFLLRMASPELYETHYDGDPLRRVK